MYGELYNQMTTVIRQLLDQIKQMDMIADDVLFSFVCVFCREELRKLLPFEELENLIHILKNTFNDFFFKTGF